MLRLFQIDKIIIIETLILAAKETTSTDDSHGGGSGCGSASSGRTTFVGVSLSPFLGRLRRRRSDGRATPSAVVVVVMVVVVLVGVVRLALELLAHVVGVLAVGVVLGLHVVDLVTEGLGVEVEGGAVAAADVEGHVLGPVDGLHGVLGGGHELGGEAELAVGAEDGEGGDVAVALGGLLLHLGQDVADDAAAVVLGDIEELRPREDVVEVVLHLVVLRQAQQVAGLHRQQVVHRRLPYAHHLPRRRRDRVRPRRACKVAAVANW